MNYAPIALFVYNRPVHTRQTVEALLGNAESANTDLYIFSDAPRGASASQAVAEVRSYIHGVAGFKSVVIVERESSFGLARSIIDGVTRLCDEYGRVVVMEDDLVTSPNFLTFMNDALTQYENEDRVMQVSGHIFQVPEFATREEALFLPFVTSWGWGTWKRAWKHFDPAARGREKINSNASLKRRFNLDGHFDYSTLLEQQMTGKVDSWAVRWYLSVFLCNGIALFPPRSLVKNIGLGSGTHGSRILRWTLAGQTISDRPIYLPDRIVMNEHDFSLVQKAIFRQMGGRLGGILRSARKLFTPSTSKVSRNSNAGTES
jgi:hypothetical protein